MQRSRFFLCLVLGVLAAGCSARAKPHLDDIADLRALAREEIGLGNQPLGGQPEYKYRYVALPGACDGTVTTNLTMCVPPRGQIGWYEEFLDAMLKIDAHAGNTTTAHGATFANDANTIVKRNNDGAIEVKRPQYLAANLPACNATAKGTEVLVIDADTATSCTPGDGGNDVYCRCDGTAWIPDQGGGGGSLQGAYDSSGTTPEIMSGANGLTLSGLNSLTKSFRICNAGQCKRVGIDGSGTYFETFDQPTDLFTKLFAGKAWGLLSSTDASLLKITETEISGTLPFQEKCLPYASVAAATDNKLLASFQQPVTIKTVWCQYEGAAPTTAAQFALEDGAGNALTHTTPVCGPANQTPVPQSITALGSLTAREAVRFDTSNTPNPTTDTYLVCLSYTLDQPPTRVTLASDDFNRADNADVGANWDQITGETQAMKIVSNTVQPTNASNDSGERYNAVTVPDDQWGQAAMTPVAGGETTDEGIGIALRVAAGANTYYTAVVHKAATNNVGVYKKVAGVYTHLATFTTAWADGDVLLFTAVGSQLRVYQNGVQIGVRVIDTSITSGAVGIKYSSSITGASLDNWSAGGFQ